MKEFDVTRNLEEEARAIREYEEALRPPFKFSLADLFACLTLLAVGMGIYCFLAEGGSGSRALTWLLWLAAGAATGAGCGAPLRLKFAGGIVGTFAQLASGVVLIFLKQPFMANVPVPFWADLN